APGSPNNVLPPGRLTAAAACAPGGLEWADRRGLMKLDFVGAGRVGTGLATAFSRAGAPVVAVASRRPESARALAREVPGARALYHASANFVGGFVIALIQEAVALWRGLGVPEEEALAALLPLARSTLANVEALGTAGGLGSAVARGDVGTIAKHLAALAERA